MVTHDYAVIGDLHYAGAFPYTCSTPAHRPEMLRGNGNYGCLHAQKVRGVRASSGVPARSNNELFSRPSEKNE